MELLEQYINVIKMYLPREQRDDIVNELYENLLSEIEDREAELGREVNEDELAEILQQHGAPQQVAKRYAPAQPTFTFGRQLIGPESFPIYVRILLIVLGCMVIVHASLAILGRSPGIGPVINSMFWTFVSVTLMSILTEHIFKNTRRFWHSPAMHYFPVPVWIPVTGFFVLMLCTLWWAAVPHFPWLIFGTAAGKLELSGTWYFYYVPVLLLLLINTIFRGVTLFRPKWIRLSLIVRMLIYFIGFAMLYFILDGYPYVSVSNIEATGQGISNLVNNINKIIYGILLVGAPIYWLISIIICGWFLKKDVLYRIKYNRGIREKKQIMQTKEMTE